MGLTTEERRRQTEKMNRCACGNITRKDEVQCSICYARDYEKNYKVDTLSQCKDVEDLKHWIENHLI